MCYFLRREDNGAGEGDEHCRYDLYLKNRLSGMLRCCGKSQTSTSNHHKSDFSPIFIQCLLVFHRKMTTSGDSNDSKTVTLVKIPDFMTGGVENIKHELVLSSLGFILLLRGVTKYRSDQSLCSTSNILVTVNYILIFQALLSRLRAGDPHGRHSPGLWRLSGP